eukprot:5862395-Prymnesium_polylepis.1
MGPVFKSCHIRQLSSMAPFVAISTPQDDSRQWEHLLSPKIRPSISDTTYFISIRFASISHNLLLLASVGATRLDSTFLTARRQRT